MVFDPVWAVDGETDEPTDGERRIGFLCGPLTAERLNAIIQEIQAAINGIDIGNPVQTSRQINTSEGLTGGGALTVDRTFKLNIPGLAAETSIANDDLVVIFDTSTNVHKKMTKENFVAGLGVGGGAISGGANIGTGDGAVFSAVNGSNLEFRKIKADTGLLVSVVSNDVVISFADLPAELTVE